MILETILVAASMGLAPAQTSGPASAPVSIHAPFSALLREYLRHDLVDYDAFAKSTEFQKYLRSLDEARPESMSKADQLAFWLNVYNAYTIELINKHNE